MLDGYQPYPEHTCQQTTHQQQQVGGSGKQAIICMRMPACPTSGNQRAKLCMTTAAISVLPSPVGRHTSVLVSSAVWKEMKKGMEAAGKLVIVAATAPAHCARQRHFATLRQPQSELHMVKQQRPADLDAGHLVLSLRHAFWEHPVAGGDPAEASDTGLGSSALAWMLEAG